MLVLGIESSCDEMAASVVRGGRTILSSVIHEQADVHEPYGGVVPELASRDHVRAVSGVVERALGEAQVCASDLDGIALTAGPGLIGSLLVGLSFGKALAWRLGIPHVGVHHLEGHLASAQLGEAALEPPFVGLVVSGGHTALYRIEAHGPPSLLGETRDDAVGEAFDKVAKLLGLGFPGGPAVAGAAEAGDEAAVALPRPMLEGPGLDFSYSGLKTAVALEVERRAPLADAALADVAASFQAAATDVLVAKARRAMAREGLGHLAVVGGVAANRRLRARMAEAGEADGFAVVFPPPSLCTDNAAMIAAAGTRLLARGERHALDTTAFSRVPLGDAPWSETPRGERRPRRSVSVSEVRALLERHGLAPRRDLGQNFLVDPDLARSLVRAAGVAPGDSVLEVGAGLGILTRALAEVAGRVTSLEVDAGLVRVLEGEGDLPAHVSLRHADVRKADLPSLVAELPAPVRLVANLPYSVGSLVLRRVLDLREGLAGWAVMVQKEVAARIVAGPGEPDYGSLAVLHDLTARVRRVRDLAPRCFHPPPQVTSTFLCLEPRADSPLRPGELSAFERVVRAAFGQRRKTLVNALRGGLQPRPDPETVRAVLADLGHRPDARAERLAPDDFLTLARALNPDEGDGSVS